jgi:transcriptional regulator with XRE-family HTH domain
MTNMRLLAELVDRASANYNGASGRRLAEAAKAAGFEVSHSTLNKIRKGTYESEPSVATLRAIAHLARVPEDKLLASIKDPQGIADAEAERVFVEWLNSWNRVQNQVLAYARLRTIPFEDAEAELHDVKSMFEDGQHGGKRPWTPPWNPGPQFRPGEEPWKREWWATSKQVPSGLPGGGRINQISLFPSDWDPERVRAARADDESDDGADDSGSFHQSQGGASEALRRHREALRAKVDDVDDGAQEGR